MVKIEKTWETVNFIASKGKDKDLITASVELEYNHATKNIRIYSPHEEGVSFKHDTIDEAYLRAEAVLAATKYLKTLK